MKNVDYLIVGGGFAGLFFAHQLIKNNKSFVLVSDRQASASEVSGGVVNPIILHKFTSFWLGDVQLQFLRSTLLEMRDYLGQDYFQELRVNRILHDENEKQTWLLKSQQDEMSAYLNPKFSTSPNVINPFGVGEVLQSGRIMVATFFNDFYNFLEHNNFLISETFDFSLFNPNHSTYQDYSYKNIIFSEGIRVMQNPYFSSLPIIPYKGHHLSVKPSQPIDDDVIFKKKYFFFKLENELYYSGGTFDRDSITPEINETVIQTLQQSIEEIYPHPYSIDLVETGLRPTLKDRRPILGAHEIFKNLFILNGMGTRGVLNGCYFSHTLYDHIENKVDLLPEINVKRYY